MNNKNNSYLGSQLNPVHDNFELRKAMLGRRNCVIYTVGTFEIAEENLYTLKISNIKLIGLAFAKMKFKPRKKERQKPLNIVIDEIHELPLNITIGIDVSEQKDRYISGGMH